VEQYPAVKFLVQHGAQLSVAVGFAPLLVVLAGAWFEGWGPVWWLAALIGGAVLGFAFRTLVELTRIIADMLLPQ